MLRMHQGESSVLADAVTPLSKTRRVATALPSRLGCQAPFPCDLRISTSSPRGEPSNRPFSSSRCFSVFGSPAGHEGPRVFPTVPVPRASQVDVSILPGKPKATFESVSAISTRATPTDRLNRRHEDIIHRPKKGVKFTVYTGYLEPKCKKKTQAAAPGGSVTTLVGSGSASFADGMGNAASFSAPNGLAITHDGASLFVGDAHNHRIRQVVMKGSMQGKVTTLAGSGAGAYVDGTGTAASFHNPEGLAISPVSAISNREKTLYVADYFNDRIRQIDLATAKVSVLAGSHGSGHADGTGADAKFNRPFGLALTPSGSHLFVGDAENNRIRMISVATAAVSTVAGSGSAAFADGVGTAASFNYPGGVAVLSKESWLAEWTTLFVADRSNNRIRQIDVGTAAVTTFAGSGSQGFADGTGAAASFYGPNGVHVSPDGTLLFVADTKNNRIRKIHIATAAVTTVAGSGSAAFADGTGAAASFKLPFNLVFGKVDLFVADHDNHRIRKVANVTTVESLSVA